jgi:hypothetical protein
MTGVEDWYRVNKGVVGEWGGKTMFNNKEYSYESIDVALMECYPDTHWQLWRFSPLPQTYWEDRDRLLECIDYLEDRLEIDEPTQWYGITALHLHAHNASTLLRYTGMHYNNVIPIEEEDTNIEYVHILFVGLLNIVKFKYPDVNWDEDTWKSTVTSKAHMFLAKAIRNTLQEDVDCEINYFLEIMSYHDTKRTLELDVWIPKYNLGFEYQVTLLLK